MDVNFVPYGYPGVPAEGAELLSAKSDGSELWFSGGGAASGPAAPREGSVPSPPLAVSYDGGFFQQAPIDVSLFGEEDRFVDVAPVPGTRHRLGRRPALRAAWQLHGEGQSGADRRRRRRRNAPRHPARQRRRARQRPAGRGHRPEEAWMATSAGWLFHYTNGTVLSEDTDPNWAGTITVRPNESVAQFVPDAPPPDDSQLFAPPPVAVEQAASAESPVPEIIPALLKDIRVSRHGLTVTVSFELTRLADVQLVAKRDGKAIARTAKERLKAGKHSLKLSFSVKRWPTGLSFKTKELTKPKPVPATGRSEPGSRPGTGPNAVTTSLQSCGELWRTCGGSGTASTQRSRAWRCSRCSGSARASTLSRRGRARGPIGAIPSQPAARARDRRCEHRADGRRDRRRTRRSVGLQGAATGRAAAGDASGHVAFAPVPETRLAVRAARVRARQRRRPGLDDPRNAADEEGQPYRGMAARPALGADHAARRRAAPRRGLDAACGKQIGGARARSRRALSGAARTARGRVARPEPAKTATRNAEVLAEAEGSARWPTRLSKTRSHRSVLRRARTHAGHGGGPLER